eukprot:GHVR01096290.1.p1 GENE.GHVR01096290.1~~GHVR01096290.1.p1  ORF type:complete len:206 (+),score=73.78 GHVR01096290.1:116-733(+)
MDLHTHTHTHTVETSISSEVRNNLKEYGSEFISRWSFTENCRLWLQRHNLPAHEVTKGRPPAEGKGTYVFSNGDLYSGGFLNHRRDGHGVYVSRNNNMRYEGEWKDDVREGNGMLSLHNEMSVYDGQWKANKRHGMGHFICPNEKYSGIFLNDLYHGHGTYVDAYGSVYDGEWQYGRPHGVGKLEVHRQSIDPRLYTHTHTHTVK